MIDPSDIARWARYVVHRQLNAFIEATKTLDFYEVSTALNAYPLLKRNDGYRFRLMEFLIPLAYEQENANEQPQPAG